ncbi:MAG TPA: acyl-CoA thioester hydrolase/BAAT C-terminal domain-containing protein [Actinocrinis sp.]|nr:acyl-CoA thioester hydrolase/BAAT C-terminal domain-containing protein [Actinocrinis sp.]
MPTLEVRELSTPCEGTLFKPTTLTSAHPATGVLVLSGSSGRLERDRARLFAERGVTALTIRWFGGPDQPREITEIPLETFTAALDLLQAEGAARLAIQGISKGAEAAMLTAIRDPRVDAVVALSPPAYSFGWATTPALPDNRQRPHVSCWTWQGAPLPFIPMDDAWLYATNARNTPGPTAIRGWYEQSERTFADHRAQSAIPIEETAADLVLVAGGDDAMWPSLRYAQTLAARRQPTPARTHLITSPHAGHRIRIPGESQLPPHPNFAYGGSHNQDSALGAKAWPTILNILQETTSNTTRTPH